MWICGYSKWSQTVDRLSVRGGYSFRTKLWSQARKHDRSDTGSGLTIWAMNPSWAMTQSAALPCETLRPGVNRHVCEQEQGAVWAVDEFWRKSSSLFVRKSALRQKFNLFPYLVSLLRLLMAAEPCSGSTSLIGYYYWIQFSRSEEAEQL